MTVKFYTSRDSAVAVLRKAGIKREDYNKHIVIKTMGEGAQTYYGADINLEHAKAAANLMSDEQVAEVVKATIAVEKILHQDELSTEEEAEAKAFIAASKAKTAESMEKLKNNPFNGLVKGETKAALKKVSKKSIKSSAPKAGKATAKKVADTAIKKATTKAKGETTRNGISDWIRDLIRKGKSNKQIIEASEKAGFDLTGKKAYFPAWYRFDMRRKGEDFPNPSAK